MQKTPTVDHSDLLRVPVDYGSTSFDEADSADEFHSAMGDLDDRETEYSYSPRIQSPITAASPFWSPTLTVPVDDIPYINALHSTSVSPNLRVHPGPEPDPEPELELDLGLDLDLDLDRDRDFDHSCVAAAPAPPRTHSGLTAAAPMAVPPFYHYLRERLHQLSECVHTTQNLVASLEHNLDSSRLTTTTTAVPHPFYSNLNPANWSPQRMSRIIHLTSGPTAAGPAFTKTTSSFSVAAWFNYTASPRSSKIIPLTRPTNDRWHLIPGGHLWRWLIALPTLLATQRQQIADQFEILSPPFLFAFCQSLARLLIKTATKLWNRLVQSRFWWLRRIRWPTLVYWLFISAYWQLNLAQMFIDFGAPLVLK
ncbi:hypothetical protein H4R33_004374 [Dimargaris cristalligena]|nr:hypothetical protein H4R33_004374 [Dimargaris cristalligena]